MALTGKLDKTNKNNVFRYDFENMYFLLSEEISMKSRRDDHAVAVVIGYADEYARHNHATPIYKRALFIPYSAFDGIEEFSNSAIRRRAYEYLKIQPGFENLKDHLIEYDGPVDMDKYWEETEQGHKSLKLPEPDSESFPLDKAINDI